MQVPLMDLKAEYRQLRDEILPAVDQALESMNLFLGPNVQALEEEWAQLCGVNYAVGVGSGTDALILSLKALGVGGGDEVITAAWTFIATIEAIVHVGAQPVLIDIAPDTYCLDSALIEPAITARTRAIIPIHVFGHPADMDRINQIADQYDLYVLEDAAQAHGAAYRGKMAGNLGDCAIFSFYMSKNLAGYGEGGMVTTNSQEIAQQIRLLRNHGQTAPYEHHLMGYNSRLDEIQAAILRVKLNRLGWSNQRRREQAALYNELLADCPAILPCEAPGAHHVYHLYTIRTDRCDELAGHLEEQDIGFARHYRYPPHVQPAGQLCGLNEVELPETDLAAAQVIQLPLHPYLSDEQIRYVATTVCQFFA